ncbi:MAG TPA: lytic transglycosylase domain-containing protein [Symbiobacteriaceae bacterium]|nr:lytic transglycosylase domain-containing protein [Symbiobacteriaceae bacterium]
MRPIHQYRSLVAIVAGLLLWSASLIGDGKAVQGAPPAEAVAAACTTRMDDFLLRAEQQLVRAAQLQQTRAEELERRQQEQEEQHQLAARQAEARRAVQARRIGDLVPDQYMNLVLDVADEFDVDPRLLASVGTVESQWYARALGTHGDSGLMQILPSTAEWIATRMGLTSYDLYDPVTNMKMGAWYLRTLYREYGDWNMALAGYNGGPRGAPRGAEHPYTRRVMSVYLQQGS